MSNTDDAIKFAEETLSGDLRNTLLTHVRAMETPWSKLSESAQRDKIYAIERVAEDCVRQAVAIIARRGFDIIPVKIADFQVKGGTVKGKFEAIVTEANVVALSDHQAQSAIIVLTDAADFIGEKEEAKADPDEPGLPLNDSLDEVEDDEEEDDGVGDFSPPPPEQPSVPAAA